MNVYLVTIVLNPTEKEKHDEGAIPSIVLQPVAVMAKDRDQAAAQAFKHMKEEHPAHRLEVHVLPFDRAGK